MNILLPEGGGYYRVLRVLLLLFKLDRTFYSLQYTFHKWFCTLLHIFLLCFQYFSIFYQSEFLSFFKFFCLLWIFWYFFIFFEIVFLSQSFHHSRENFVDTAKLLASATEKRFFGVEVQLWNNEPTYHCLKHFLYSMANLHLHQQTYFLWVPSK